MSYKFIGVISQEDIRDYLPLDSHGYVAVLPEPHLGWIASLGHMEVMDQDRSPKYQQWLQTSTKMLNSALLYLEYVTWGGSVDSVKGEIWCDGTMIFMHEGETLADFLEIMTNFGLDMPDDGFFAAFTRGFFQQVSS